MFLEDDGRLPCGADRNGQHWLRVELSSTLLKYRTALAWQLWGSADQNTKYQIYL